MSIFRAIKDLPATFLRLAAASEMLDIARSAILAGLVFVCETMSHLNRSWL
jgi:hypothetical protein